MVLYTNVKGVLEYARLVSKEDLGYTDEDEWRRHITTMIKSASRDIDRYCRRNNDFFSGGATITEYHDGHPLPESDYPSLTWMEDESLDDRRIFWFKEFPIISVTSIHVNLADVGTADNYSEITSGYYRFNTQTGKIIIAKSKTPNVGHQNVRLIYVAGYSTVPDEVAEVCAQLVANRLLGEAQQYGSQLTKWGSPTAPDYQVPTFLTKDMKRRLDPYKKRRV